MGVIPGAVTPFGLLNDKELKVKFFIDKEFAKTGHLIAVHPNDNTATVYLKAEDLIDIIKRTRKSSWCYYIIEFAHKGIFLYLKLKIKKRKYIVLPFCWRPG